MIDFSKEIIFSSSNPAEAKMIEYRLAKGTIRKIAPKIYTTNMTDDAESIIRNNLFYILGKRFPGAVLSYSSAVLLRPDDAGHVYLNYRNSDKITDIPGITVHLIKGPGPTKDDFTIGDTDLHVASEARWSLEIMRPTRKNPDGSTRSIAQEAMERRLEKKIVTGGERKLNEFREELKEKAQKLNLNTEYEKLNKIISALLNTHEAKILKSITGKARAAGMPLDPERIRLFEILHEELKKADPATYPSYDKSKPAFKMFAFFEAYFSNYIEGTKFDINDARKIIETGQTLPRRFEDSHDILDTYRIVSDRKEMSVTPTNEDEFIALLKKRHKEMLNTRTELRPGEFKEYRNMAGSTLFVEPELVEGTLRYGFKFYKALANPLSRAIFMMFLCSEVHPFNDGNGRISRIMMNSELVSTGLNRIVIPTVFRDDYILSLKRLSRDKVPEPYIKVMSSMHAFSANLWGESFNSLNQYLSRCYAYAEPDEARLHYLDRLGMMIKETFGTTLKAEERKELDSTGRLSHPIPTKGKEYIIQRNNNGSLAYKDKDEVEKDVMSDTNLLQVISPNQKAEAIKSLSSGKTITSNGYIMFYSIAENKIVCQKLKTEKKQKQVKNSKTNGGPHL